MEALLTMLLSERVGATSTALANTQPPNPQSEELRTQIRGSLASSSKS